MAVLFAIEDDEPARRDACLEKVSARMASTSRPLPAPHRLGGLQILISASGVVPVSKAVNGDTAALVLGHVSGAASAAAWVVDAAVDADASAANAAGGAYLACIVDRDAVTLASDVLGLVPLYVWSSPDVFLASTEPSLILAHPLVPERISPEGLVGILLTGNLANGKSIWEGIERPEAGELVRWRRGEAARFEPANALDCTEALFDLSYGEARARVMETLDAAVGRCLSFAPPTLMLSGGLDSRLLAAMVDRRAPGVAEAITFGDAGDTEARCAARVARHLAMPFHRAPVPFDRFRGVALRCIAREQLSNTLFDFAWVAAAEGLSFPGPAMMNGFLGDAVCGGSVLGWGYDAKRGQYNFETLCASMTAWGLSPAQLRDLLALDNADRVIRDVLDEMRARYEALPGLPYQKVMLSVLQHRSRFHVFPYAWRMASKVWPLMPYMDRPVLETAFAVPVNYIARRRMQIDTLKHDYPGLARLPVDRNSLDDRPLLPSLSWSVGKRLQRLRSKLMRRQRDPRVYFRTFDINNAGWRSIREAADVHRPLAKDIFRADALEQLLPPYDRRIVGGHGIRDIAGCKTLTAMLLWLADEQTREYLGTATDGRGP